MSKNSKPNIRDLGLYKKVEYVIDDPRGYTIEDNSKMAQLVDQFMTMGRKRLNTIYATASIDVTDALVKLKKYKERTGKSISFTGFIIAVFARVVAYHKKPMNAMIKRRKKIYIFDDVDVSTNMERILPDGSKNPVSFTIRKAHKKTLKEISDEIRAAQQKKKIQASSVKRRGLMASIGKNLHKMPRFIQKLVISKILSDPIFKKKNFGTVNVSSVATFSSALGHPIFITPHNCSLGVGGIDCLPLNVNGEIVNRDQVGLTLAINHAVIDGAPATRFFNDFKQWIEKYCHDADWCFKSLEG